MLRTALHKMGGVLPYKVHLRFMTFLFSNTNKLLRIRQLVTFMAPNIFRSVQGHISI